MITRKIASEIMENMAYFPAIGIIGPRQVGKTTLAKELQRQLQKPSIYLDLELDEDLVRLQNAQAYLQSHQDKCVIIDEIQLMPRLFPLLRALIDQERVPARFLILGSASPVIIRQRSETLAGRIVYNELAPLSLSEVQSSGITMTQHWFRGGFPNALLAPTDDMANKWLRNFANTFMEKDLKAMGYEISLQTMSKLYRMLAHVHGQLQNVNTLSQALGVSNPTVAKYLDLLEGGFLIHRLEPYYVNLGKRLVKSPKIYFRDTGLLHQLSTIPNFEALQGNQLIGPSWEGYVIEQIRRAVDASWQFYFYRTIAGAETDLLLISPNGTMTCIEIKYATAPAIAKGFYQSVADLKPAHQYVIVPTGTPYFLKDNLKVRSLPDFLANELAVIK
ncbi:MAG: ATP-binding protein [Bacteroidota bacterium]